MALGNQVSTFCNRLHEPQVSIGQQLIYFRIEFFGVALLLILVGDFYIFIPRILNRLLQPRDALHYPEIFTEIIFEDQVWHHLRVQLMQF
jgi:hypothetical protein